MTKALAIDTSNQIMGVAVASEEHVLGEFVTNVKKNHSVRLMPAIEKIMNEVQIEPKDLDRVIVAAGPGSYTGVRIGVTTAKTLAWSLKIPIVGVSSLEVLAQNGRYFQGVVVPFFDARRTQVYAGIYKQSESGEFGACKEDRLLLMSDLLEELKEMKKPVLFLSQDLPMFRPMIEEALGDRAYFGGIADHSLRPAFLAELGLKKEPQEVHSFVPHYLKLAEAEEKWLAAKKK